MEGPAARPVLAAYRVGDRQAGLRLDQFLKTRIPKLSRTGIQRVIRARVELPGRRAAAKPSLVMRRGDLVVLRQQPCDEPPLPEALFPAVLYVDDHLIAVDKPPGLAVHATRHAVRAHLVGWLRDRFGPEVALAHRIDRETSGVVLSTRTTTAARKLGYDFSHGRVHKEYLAVVDGVPPAQFTVDQPVGPDADSLIFIKQRAGGPGGAPATTRFVRERLTGDRQRALVRAFPRSGRRHQIRVHLAARGFPVVGDKLYRAGDRAFLRYIARGLDGRCLDAFGAARQLLHAAVLRIEHPHTGRPLRFNAAMPADLERALACALEP